MPEIRFVMLSHGRAGTNAMAKALGERPGIEQFGEIFHPDLASRSKLRGIPLAENRPSATLVEEVLFGQSRRRVCGFRLFWFHARDNDTEHTIWPWLEAHTDLRLLIVVRRNLLHAFLSEERARATGSWHPRPGQPALPIAPLHVNVARAMQYVTSNDVHRRWALDTLRLHPILEVAYEDMAEDFAREVNRASGFLDLPEGPVATPFIAREPPISAQTVRNLPELAKAFRRSIYGWMLGPDA